MQITDKSVDVFREKLAVFRAGWKELLVREMGEREGGVLAAILLGEKSDMDSEMKELYQVNGLGISWLYQDCICRLPDWVPTVYSGG